MTSSSAQIERIRRIETEQERVRVGLREIGRFHEVAVCPDCDRELPDAEDELECSCGYTRYIPPWLREDAPDEGRPDPTADGRLDWGRVPGLISPTSTTVSQSVLDLVASRGED